MQLTPNRRIILNIVATYGRSLLSLVCGLFTGRWVLQALGQTDFGLYGVVGGLTIFISFFNTLLASAISRFYAFSVGAAQVARDKVEGLEECRRWFSIAVAVHIIVPILLTGIGYPIGVWAVRNFLRIPVERIETCIWVFRYVCLSSFVAMVNVPFAAMYTAKQNIAELTVYSMVQTLANVCFLYYLVSHQGDWLNTYALGTCIIAIVPQLCICMRACCKFRECRFVAKYCIDIKRVAKLANYSMWQVFGSLGGLAQGQGMAVLVNKFFGAKVNAAMSISNQVSSQTASLSNALLGAFSPAIINAYGARKYDVARVMSYRACKFGLLLLLLFALPLSLELRKVVQIWLITPPANTVLLCMTAITACLIRVATTGHMIAVNANGRVALYQFSVGSSLIMSIPIGWGLVKYGLGVWGIAVAILVSTMCCSIGRVCFARYLVGLSFLYWLRRIVLPVLAVALITILAGMTIRYFMEESFLRIVITTIICEVVFLPLAWFVALECDERDFVKTRVRTILNKVVR